MSIGFKEWALVCHALGRGEQSLILRKGGVAEGRDGFSFKHPEFFLVPTLFHEQVEKLKLPSHTKLPEHEPGIIRIQYLARQEWTSTISDWQIARALDAFHVWREEVIAERFQYDSAKCLHVAFVRIFQLDQPWTFPEQPAYFGCRSWISLPEPPKIALAPVLADSVHRELAERAQHLLSDATRSGVLHWLRVGLPLRRRHCPTRIEARFNATELAIQKRIHDPGALIKHLGEKRLAAVIKRQHHLSQISFNWEEFERSNHIEITRG